MQSAASHPIGERGAVRKYALHECRDSACRRNLGTCVWALTAVNKYIYQKRNDTRVVPYNTTF